MIDPYAYLLPTQDQIASMKIVRAAALEFHKVLMENLPNGPDKTYCIRNHRTTAMWANIAITRQSDGAPRDGESEGK